MIINTSKDFASIEKDFGSDWKLALVDANRLPGRVLGVTIVNTTMLGALLKAVEVVKMDSLIEPIKERFERLAEKNINAVKRAFAETKVKE